MNYRELMLSLGRGTLTIIVLLAALSMRAMASVDYEFILSAPTQHVTVTASTSAANSAAVNAFDNEGMSGVSYPIDRHDTNPRNMWMTVANDPAPHLEIDLGAAYPIGKMPVWNYNGFVDGQSLAGRGVKFCKVYYSVTSDGPWTQLVGLHAGREFELALANTAGLPTGATNQVGGQPIDFAGAPAQYIKIVPRASNNWGGARGDRRHIFIGLSQVRVYRYASSITTQGQYIASRCNATHTGELALADETDNNANMSDAGSGRYTDKATVGVAQAWMTAANDKTPYLEYDLGGTYPIKDMAVWNLNDNDGATNYSGRGIKTARIYYSVTNPGYGKFGWTQLMNGASDTWTFAKALGSPEQPVTSDISFLAKSVAPEARYIIIVPTSNWGGAPGDGVNTYYGLSQVRFFAGAGTIAEPDPSWTGILGQRSSTQKVWSGADVCDSIPYFAHGKRRSLFVFGDTWAGTWNPTTYKGNTAQTGNGSFGIYTDGHTQSPSLSSMSFDYLHSMSPSAKWPNTFYWVYGGAYIGGDKPAIYLDAGRYDKPWSPFPATAGNNLIRIPISPDGIPAYSSDTQIDSGAYYAGTGHNDEISFIGDMYDNSSKDGFIYIYGSMGDGVPAFGISPMGATVARTTPQNLGTPSKWTFLSSYTPLTWSSNFRKAIPISPPGYGLGSVSPAWDKAGQYVMTSRYGFFGPIDIAYASTPYGPFGNLTTWTPLFQPNEADPIIYGDPQMYGNNQVVQYAITNHPEIAAPGEGLISYANYDLSVTINNADLYHHRFVRVRTIK